MGEGKAREAVGGAERPLVVRCSTSARCSDPCLTRPEGRKHETHKSGRVHVEVSKSSSPVGMLLN